jgi:GNAT superfamily N-acetyltransferase
MGAFRKATTMIHLPLHILRMSRAELILSMDWARQEGWNPGRQDADIFHPIDVRGHFMAWMGDEPVASISGLRYGVSYGFIGLHIVPPHLRGQGLGQAVWNAALEHLRGCVVGLDGPTTPQPHYRRSGFDLAWHSRRYQAMGRAPRPRDPHIVKLTAIPFAALASYDRAFHPEPRPVFLQAWIQQRHGMALGWWQERRLRGYGVVRASANGHRIGPLCADTPAIADALLDGLLGCVMPRDPVYLDVPEPNREALALAARHGMAPGVLTARMYRGPAPRIDLARQYALTALEVG